MTEKLEMILSTKFSFMKTNKVDGEKNIYKRWGCECSDGWFQLINDLCQAITDRYNQDSQPIDIVVEQVKEKFASLRFYYSYEDAPCSIHALDFLGSGLGIRFTPTSENTDDRKLLLRKDIAKIVREYETKSKSVCEVCGNTGTIRMDLPWKRTLCDKCYFEHMNRRKNK